MNANNYLWPGDKKIAVIFNVCLEAWSDGKAPGISPMGNPLPPVPGIVDTMANSWASYGHNKGIYRLLASFRKFGIKASVMINGVVAERAPESVRACADGGHEIVAHSYAMDVIPLLLSEEAESANIVRSTELLAKASGAEVKGWLSPRGTPSANTPRLLAEAGYVHFGDVFDDDLPYAQEFGGKKIVSIPFNTDVNDMPSMKYGSEPGQMLETFKQNMLVARASDELTIIDVTTHAHIFGRPRGAYFHEQIIEAAAADSSVWVATRMDVAKHFLKQAQR